MGVKNAGERKGELNKLFRKLAAKQLQGVEYPQDARRAAKRQQRDSAEAAALAAAYRRHGMTDHYWLDHLY